LISPGCSICSQRIGVAGVIFAVRSRHASGPNAY
jgi:hypothetical protein